MSKKLFFIAGEASGDLHGAHLAYELKKSLPDLECRGLGGAQMQAEGVSISHDLTKEAVLGFGDVLRKYFHFKKIFDAALAEVEAFKPDAIILIDCPGFNLRFAKKIAKRFPVIYYVSPQLWAWGARRIQTVRNTVNHMICFFKFEAEMYHRYQVPVTWVGHPLVGHTRPTKHRAELREAWLGKDHDTRKAVALFPGSRATEVKRILPEMLKVAERLNRQNDKLTFLLCESDTLPESLYTDVIDNKGRPRNDNLRIKRFRNRAYDLFFASDFAMVTSGTATLEAALASLPFVIFYKTAWSTYFLARHLIRIPFIGLVNVVAGRKVVPEFIQGEIHTETIAHEAKYLLEHQDLREKMILELKNVQEKLGPEGAARRAADAVLQVLGVTTPVSVI